MHIADFAIGHARRQRHRRRRHADRLRRGARRPDGRQRRCRRVLLRRRRHRRGRVPRDAQHRLALEAARCSSCARTTATAPATRSRRCARSPTSRCTRRPTGCPASRSTATTCSRSATRRAQAVERARRGDGPTLLHCKTFRSLFHAMRDAPPPETRSPEILAEWKARDRDAVARFEDLLTGRGLVTPADVAEIRADGEARPEAAVEFAEKSPYSRPERSARRHVRRVRSEPMREITVAQALEEAMTEEMRRTNASSRWPPTRARRRSRTSSATAACASRRSPRRRFTGHRPGRGGQRLRPVVHWRHGHLLVRRDGSDRQPGEQDPLHVRRPGQLPGDLSMLDGRRRADRRPALAEPVLDVHAPRRAEDHPAVDAGGREGAARRARSATTTR